MSDRVSELVLVPREPTQAMIQAAAEAWDATPGMWDAFCAAIKAGIAAAPAAQESQPTPRTAGCLMCGHCAATGERVTSPAAQEANAIRNACPRSYNRCGFDAVAGKCVAEGCGGPLKREHEASAECWCGPGIDYTDPETGVSVYVHKDMQ